MRISLWLPTFAADTVATADARVVDLARLAEGCGLDGLWVIDHMLPTTDEVHSGSWYDPIVSLAAAAAVTERLELGTASLVAGPRHPVALAKQVASLAALAGPRVTIGLSSGWAPEEYECFGYRLKERGDRTDEVAAVLRQLLETAPVDSPGPRYPFENVRLVPRPRWRIPILVGGGSRTPESGSAADRPHMAASVLERIKRFDGWLAPCAGDESMTLADLALVNEAVGDREFRRVHVQWTHIVDTDDTDRALAEQIPAFGRVMGDRSIENLRASYLTGSWTDITDRALRIAAAGFDDMIVGPVESTAAQVELISELASVVGGAIRVPAGASCE